MCVLLNDPFYQTAQAILGLTYREVWEWVVRGPYEQARKDSGRPAAVPVDDADAVAASVAGLIGAENAALVAAAIRESEATKRS